MWFPAIAALMLLSAVAGQAPTQPVAPPLPLPNPIVTRQNHFAIPYSITPADHPLREPAEVLLYVSNDHGRTWRLHAKSDPAERQFLFRWPCDGEFWFVMRTVDRSGQARPTGMQAPGLRVIIDTVPPAISLEAKVGLGGQVTARWLVEEANPNCDTFSIQYRGSAHEPWQTVAIDHRDFASSGTKTVGEATWVPSGASGLIEIRAEVTDAASNSAVSLAQIDLRQTAVVQSVSKPLAAGNAPAPTPAVAVAVKPNPPIGDNRDERTTSAAPATPRDWPYWVNKKVFDVNYGPQTAGQSGLERVEVWGTRDGGRTWKCFAVDDDNLSPVSVKVDEEGIHGFRVVMQGTTGAGRQPKSGEVPDLWIGVDGTPPVVKILAALQDSRAEAGELTITWKASDQNLVAQPITLYYGERPSGPWTPIASGLPNTGNYAWTLPRQASVQIYLRLEARDQAGNIGRDDAGEPVRLNPIRASAEARRILPFGLPLGPSQETSRSEPKHSYFK